MEIIISNSKWLGEQKTEEARQSLADSFQTGSIPLSGELDKTPTEIIIIQLFQDFLREDIKKLGVANPSALELERVHILPEDTPHLPSWTNGYTEPARNSILVKRRGTFANQAERILHEMIHWYGLTSYIVYGQDERIRLRRSGYFLQNPNGKQHEHFRAFNEGVVDNLMREFISHNDERIQSEVMIPWEEKDFQSYYVYYSDAINNMQRRIAITTNTEAENIWRQVKAGYYTGRGIPFRVTERVLGRGSIRMIGAWGSDTKEDLKETPKELDLLENYFSNPSEQVHTARELLDDPEYEYWLKKYGRYVNLP